MPRKKFKLDSLKRPRLRQSWHPINLYNLSRQEPQSTRERTFFQQKWTAKSLTRSYHGEQIREGQWELQFSRRIPSVVPMDAAVLAKSDGSDMAAGRGSGKEEKGSGSRILAKPTPYMSMTFFPQERRLDTCMFRALFASSIRQARNMVTHGHVKVNGKKVRRPIHAVISHQSHTILDDIPWIPPQSRRHVLCRSRNGHVLHWPKSSNGHHPA